MVDSSDSLSYCFESQQNNKPLPSSPLKRKHDDDDNNKNVSYTEAMVRRRKQQKTTLIWTKNNVLGVLKGIVEYENERGFRYNSDWDIFYEYMKDFINTHFSKKQLMDKVKKLKKRFKKYWERFNGWKELSFTNSFDGELLRLSMLIWVKNDTEDASNENRQDQAQVLFLNKDVPCVEQKRVSYTRMDKDESDQGGVDEFYVLQDALEEATSLQSLGKTQHKMLFQNVKTLGAHRRKELTDEWKALLNEGTELHIKKLTFFAKLAYA